MCVCSGSSKDRKKWIFFLHTYIYILKDTVSDSTRMALTSKLHSNSLQVVVFLLLIFQHFANNLDLNLSIQSNLKIRLLACQYLDAYLNMLILRSVIVSGYIVKMFCSVDPYQTTVCI